MEQSVVDQVSAELQAYVYMLVDPVSGVPFYVGKGHGVRHAAHLAEALVPLDEEDGTRSRKLARIDEILAGGNEPDVWILRYGLNHNEYSAVEAAAIDLLMSFQIAPNRSDAIWNAPLARAAELTNARREYSRGHGVTLLTSLIEEFAAPDLVTTQPLLLITLNGWYEYPEGESIAGGRLRYEVGYSPEWLSSDARRGAYASIGDSVSAWWSPRGPFSKSCRTPGSMIPAE